MVTGNTDMSILPYSVPIGLLTEAILHANNTRDIKPDSKANITTLAIVLGHEGSYVFYQMLLVGAYVSVAAISFYLRYGALLAFITVPLAVQLCRGFIKNKMEGLVEETAKFHLPFGILLFLGVMLTDKGLAEMLLSTA
jgi:1,4-dihydroxy-2-naphthoate octaprenyltransferase